MSVPWWLTSACLVAAAAVAGWPARHQRARRRVVIDRGSGSPRRSRRRWSRGIRPSLPRSVSSSPRRTLLLVAGLAGAAGFAVAGPVAAIALAAYGGLAMRAVLRRSDGRRAERERHRRLDALCALAADLRAGLPVPAALAVASGAGPADPPATLAFLPDPGRPALPGRRATVDRSGVLGRPAGADRSGRPADATAPDRIDALTLAAGRLAEQTGAPLADLVERIEADARAMDRGLAGAAAQAAGARATALLLAALPLGGIALGYGIGVDPLGVLLHTPIGAACAVGAIVLQLAGLAWAERLGGMPRAA